MSIQLLVTILSLATTSSSCHWQLLVVEWLRHSFNEHWATTAVLVVANACSSSRQWMQWATTTGSISRQWMLIEWMAHSLATTLVCGTRFLVGIRVSTVCFLSSWIQDLEICDYFSLWYAVSRWRTCTSVNDLFRDHEISRSRSRSRHLFLPRILRAIACHFHIPLSKRTHSIVREHIL